MDIGSRIRELRTEHGFTQRQLADALFVSRQTIISWEQGRTIPDAQSLVMLGALMGIPVDSILKGDAGLSRRVFNAHLRVGRRLVAVGAAVGAVGAAASLAALHAYSATGAPLGLVMAGIPFACCAAMGVCASKRFGRWDSNRLLLACGRYPLEASLRCVREQGGLTMRFENREGRAPLVIEPGLPVPRGTNWTIRVADGARISTVGLRRIVVGTPTPYIKAYVEGFGPLRLERSLELRGLYQDVWRLSGQDVEVEGDWLGADFEFRADGATFADVCVSDGTDAGGIPVRSYRMRARNAWAMPLAVTLCVMFALMQDVEAPARMGA